MVLVINNGGGSSSSRSNNNTDSSIMDEDRGGTANGKRVRKLGPSRMDGQTSTYCTLVVEKMN